MITISKIDVLFFYVILHFLLKESEEKNCHGFLLLFKHTARPRRDRFPFLGERSAHPTCLKL